jgi:cytoskeletal protein RodZ
MESVFQELKRAREARKLSITDIDDVTLINPGFLEAIEQGNTNILPQTYVRAFIREYASVVGLDPVTIMQHYDKERTDTAKAVEPPPPEPAPEPQKPAPVRKEPAPFSPPEWQSRIVGKYSLPALAVVILGIVIWNLTGSRTPQTNETPFEAAANKGTDTLRRASVSPPIDRLTLRARTTDSVWVEIAIDSLAPRQYLFRPNRSVTWRARDRFRVTVGNPNAIQLTLNDKPVGPAGKRQSRNMELSRLSLQK